MYGDFGWKNKEVVEKLTSFKLIGYGKWREALIMNEGTHQLYAELRRGSSRCEEKRFYIPLNMTFEQVFKSSPDSETFDEYFCN